ncbi:MAG: efflux RND transporter permease subunit [Rhodothalassiaceae bacterium]
MTLTDKALRNPAAMAVMVAIIFAFGLLAIFRLPLQLFPAIERPVIAVQTSWRAASPVEIESEITGPLEEVLEGLPGMTMLRSWSNAGDVWINMEFGLETDMDQTLIEVISRLNRLPPLPADADPPRVMAGGWNNEETLIYLFVQLLPGSKVAPNDLARTIEDRIIPRLEAVEGVARVDLQAGASANEQVQIVFDPLRAAQLGIDISAMASSIGRPSDSSGGFVDVGRRTYTLRFEGRYEIAALADKILAWRDGAPVRLGDVATIEVLPQRTSELVYQNGNPAMGMNVRKASGANVLATVEALTAVVDEMNGTVLSDYGLQIEKSFDPSLFIRRAINLLTSNLFIGMALAVGLLWWFLRAWRATALIATTIPICLMATFVVLSLAGRSLNVISLAGLAFATGMVLDAAIVVLETIVRRREAGESAKSAASTGAREVWGALLASTVTTVAIFVPIIFLKDVEGQLFADLAFTIAVAVGCSLIVAVTVLPVASRSFLRRLPPRSGSGRWEAIAGRIVALTDGRVRRLVLIAALVALPIGASLYLMPAMNYLPPVKRDAVDAFVMFPSGSNAETVREEFAEIVIERLAPFMSGEKSPALRNYYIITWPNGSGGTLGIRAKDQSEVKELERIVREEILVGFPDVMAFAAQGNLFGGFGGDGGISLNLQSADLPALMTASLAAADIVREALPGAQVRANPDPQVVSPEIRLVPDDQRLAEMGYSRDDIARIMRALGNGLWLGEYFDGDRRLDIILRSETWLTPEMLAATPIATPSGVVLPLGDLVTLRRDVGPVSIQRYNGRRTISLDVNPPDSMPLGDAVAALEQVEDRIRAVLPGDASISYGGSADSLKRAITTLGGNFALALGLLFLILAALFRSLRDAGLVVIAIPLATVGGVIALRLLNLIAFQPMDLLTMIGMIILLGLVVNNAILLVAGTRAGEAEGLDRREAVRRALAHRLRPILMSTGTSIAGMLPLVLFPGAGSAIYRGMATTIVGGMSVSTLFTLILLPCLLRLGRLEEPNPAPQHVPAPVAAQ